MGSKGQGAGSKGEGAGGKEQGARSKEQGAGGSKGPSCLGMGQGASPCYFTRNNEKAMFCRGEAGGKIYFYANQPPIHPPRPSLNNHWSIIERSLSDVSLFGQCAFNVHSMLVQCWLNAGSMHVQ